MPLNQILTPEQKFLQAYDKSAKALWRYAFFRVSSNEQAEDLVSETFMRAWDHYRDNPVVELRPLLYRILHNLIIDYYRKQKPILSLEEISELPAAKSKLTASLDWSDMQKLLVKLPDNYQQVLIWRYINDLDIGEIAKIMGKSTTGIYVTIHRALKMLRRFSAEQQIYETK
jgi:RNA polymerase sigma-70 factor (ECF subfamily)